MQLQTAGFYPTVSGNEPGQDIPTRIAGSECQYCDKETQHGTLSRPGQETTAQKTAPAMSIFDFATVAISFILGLAVTYLLESLVQAFRMRRQSRLSWLPFAWTGFVLTHQFQFWWALYEVHTINTLSVGIFILLLCLSSLLFLAGALVLPSGETEYPTDLARYFIVDGSWGVAALALYNLTAVVVNVALFDSPFASTVNLLNLGLAAIALLTAITRSYIWQASLTIAFALLFAFTASISTQGTYQSSGHQPLRNTDFSLSSRPVPVHPSGTNGKSGPIIFI
jgi:hypothetical protein